MTDADLSIERITKIAISEACDVISHKVGRELTAGESNAVAAIIDTEHFWVRAEELQMFVQHKDTQAVSDMLISISERYQQFGKAAFAPVEPVAPQQRDCGICNGSGQCYCLRKGSGTAVGCPRCAGDAKCRHCTGSGILGGPT